MKVSSVDSIEPLMLQCLDFVDDWNIVFDRFKISLNRKSSLDLKSNSLLDDINNLVSQETLVKVLNDDIKIMTVLIKKLLKIIPLLLTKETIFYFPIEIPQLISLFARVLNESSFLLRHLYENSQD